jgi:DNA repair exonuclease SbcCD ATPase subunit
LFGTGNDLNTGTFLTLNGKRAKDSIEDFRKAFSEANDMGVTKKGTLFSWLIGNFNNDYDFVKDLDADTEALKKFKDAYTNKKNSSTFNKKKESFDATLKNSSVILQDFVNHTDDASISVENFFSSVTGAGKLTNALKGIGLQMLTTAAQAAAIWAITEGFKLLVNWVDKLYRSGEIAKEKMEESKKTYQDTTDEIKSLNDELEENKKRIAEINGQDVITYTDKQELEKLETANTRLERQIELKEHLAEMQAKEAVNDAVNSFNENYGEDYFGDGFDLDKKGPTDFINYKGLFDSIRPDEFGDKILERSNDIREYSAAIDYLNDKIDKYNQMAAVAATPDEEQTWLKQAELYQTQLEKINQGILDQADDLETYKETLDLVGFDNLTSTQKKIYNQIEDALKYNYMKTDPASWFEQNFNDSKYADVVSKLKEDPEGAGKALIALNTQAENSGKSLGEMLDIAKKFFGVTSEFDDYSQALKDAKDKADAAGVSLGALFNIADNESFRNLFSSGIDLDLLAEFIKYMQDAGFAVEDVITELKSFSQAGVEANSVTIDADTAVKNVTTTISAVTAALQAQTTGVGVTAENFKALTDADKDYADCLKYVNGTMQINTEKAKKLTDKKIEEAKATVRVARSQAQLKYAENKQELSRLNDELKKNNNLSEEQQSTLKEAISNREQENKKLREQCQNYEVLYSQLMQASGAYQDWLNAQNATEAGTMYDDAIQAYDAIKDALESGKIGTQKYKAAVEFLVPKSVDENAVQQYVDTLKKYLTDDSKGVTNFLNDAVKAGLMEEDSSGYVTIAGKKTIDDFCDALKLTPDMVRAIFGELQEYGFDFNWDDAFFGETLTSLEMQADELQEKMDSVKPDSDSYKEWNDQLKEVNEKIENIKGNIDNTDVDALVDAYEKAKDAVDQMNSQGSTFDGQADELQSALDKAADNLNKNGRVQLWIDASEAEKTVDDLTQKFNSGDFSVATELEAAQDKLADLNTQKEKLGAPTEVEIQVYAQGLEDVGKSTEEIAQTLKDAKILNVETDDSEDKLSQTKDTVTDIANMLLAPYTLDLNTTEALTKLGTVRDLMNQISETTITAPVPSVPKSYAERITTGTTGTGSANATGTNGGLARAERALVGELGYEVVVNPHSGKWYTVGEHGAEFVNLPKDAIVFDHQKSEELLKNGFVGARGMAMAEGNAYNQGVGTITGGGYIPKNNPATSTTFQKNAKAAAATATATEAAQKNLERIEAEADAVKEAYEAQKKALEKQKKELESIKDSLESEQKTLDGIVKTVTARIDKEIDRLEHQWDDLKEQLEDEKNNLDAAMNGATYLIEKRTKALQKEQEALDDSYQPRIDALQDELDKLNETNDAQEKAIELARKKAAMDAAKANRSVRVYREGKGFVWEADESEVKSTEEDYNDALRQKEHEDAQKALEDQKAALEKELEDKKQELQDKIDAYDEYKDKLSEGQNEYTNSKNVAILRQLYGANADQMILNMDQAMIDKITTDYMNNMSNTDHVENQIKENQKLIDQLEDYKSKWEEVADAYETEQNRINTVARLGADWEEKILGQRTDVLDNFKNHYIDILRQIEEKTAEINDLNLKIEVVEEEYQTKSDELDKEKKAAQAEVKTTKSSSTSSHATGIMNVAAFERAHVDEAGPEIVVRQPEAGRYTSLEVGDGVVPGNLTRRLFSAAINPEAFVESAILKRMGNVNAELASAGSSGVHIGDINIVMNGVNDVENFGRILHQNIGSIMAQEFSKR